MLEIPLELILDAPLEFELIVDDGWVDRFCVIPESMVSVTVV